MKKTSLLLSALLALGIGGVAATVGQSALSYNVSPQADSLWTGNPADGSTVEELDIVTITFTDFTPEEYGDGSVKITWNGDACDYAFYNLRGKSIYFDVPRGKSYPSGDGTLVIDATEGYMIDTKGNPSPAFTYTLHVGDEPAPQFAWAGNPADGSTVKDVNNFSISFPGFESVEITSNAAFSITWNDSDVSQSFAIKNVQGNTVNFGFGRSAESEGVSGEGELKVAFDAGSFKLDGKVLSEAFTYTLTQDPDASVVVANTFAGLVSNSDPVVGGFSFDRVMGEFSYVMKSDVEIDTSVEEPINLMLNGKMIGSVQPADDDAVQVFDGNIVSLSFGIDESSEGVYTVEIPTGAFTSAGQPLGGCKMQYLMGVGTFTPELGEINVAEKGWSYVIVNLFNGVDLAEVNGAPGTTEPARLTCGNEVIAQFYCGNLTALGGKLRLNLPKTINSNGEYTLSFPEGFFMTTGSETPILSDAFDVKYTVVGGEEGPEQVYKVTPEAGSYDVFPTITLTYEGCTSIAVTNGAKAEMRVSNNTEVSLYFTITADGNVVTLTPDEDYSKYGGSPYTKMTVTIPADSYKLTYSGKQWPNEEVKLDQYKINAPVCPSVTADPENGSVVSELETITCTVPVDIATFQISLKKPKIYRVVDGVRESTQLGSLTGKLNSENKKEFTLTNTLDLEAGEYDIVLASALYIVNIDGTRLNSPEQVLHYTVKGLPQFAWEGDPANGSTVQDVNTFSISFPGFSSVEVTDNAAFSITWNGSDVSQNFAIKSVQGNTVSFGFGRSAESTGLTGEGELKVTFDAGSFLLNGKVTSTDFEYVLYQDPGTVVNPEDSFETFISEGDPAVGGFAFDRILGAFAYMMKEDVAVDTTVEESIDLLLNGTMIGSVQPADDDAVQVFDGNIVSIDFGVEEEAEGIYTVRIPNGAFTLNNQPLKGCDIKYYVGVGTFNPAAGEISVAEKAWSYIMVNLFSGVDLAEIDGAPGTTVPARITKGGEVVAEFYCGNLTALGGKLRLNLPKAIDSNGEYTLSFPEGFFMTTGSETPILSDAFDVKYTVVGGEEGPDQIYEVTPDAGSYDVFPTITLTYEGCTSIAVTNGAKAKMRVSNNTEVSLYFTITADGNVVTLTPDEDYSKYGGSPYTKMTVTIPEGSYNLTYSGKQWPNVEVKLDQYKINAPVCPSVVADPENGSVVAKLETITCTVPVDIATFQISLKKPKIYRVVDGVRESTQLGTLTGKLNSENKKEFTLTNTLDLEAGEYDIVLASALYIVNIDGTRLNSPEQVLHYTVNPTEVGVAGVDAESTVTVFTTTGVCILKNAPAEELSKLEKGLYIINGKKVAIK